MPHSFLTYVLPLRSMKKCPFSSPRSSTCTRVPSSNVMVFHIPRLAGMAWTDRGNRERNSRMENLWTLNSRISHIIDKESALLFVCKVRHFP